MSHIRTESTEPFSRFNSLSTRDEGAMPESGSVSFRSFRWGLGDHRSAVIENTGPGAGAAPEQ